MFRALSSLAALVILTSLPAAAQVVPEKSLAPSQKVSPDILVNRIDVNCGVTKNFIKTVKPKHVALQSSTWKLVSDSDEVVAERTHAAVMLADVWSMNNHYVWVHSHTIAQGGAQHATQLCFRTDGTLARIRQATNIPATDTSAAKVAYYNTDGSLIRSVGIIATNDPTIQKKITAEPFYSVLP